MCGRFSQTAELSEVRLELKLEQLELFREFRCAFNIGPSYAAGAEQAFVVRTPEGERALRLGRWWMIPHFWAKPLKALPPAFNARAEDLEHKPFWRQALRERRCLVPATGYREFKAEGKRKQPYHFQLGGRLFAFAGLWSRWTTPDGELVDSFAVITVPANASAAEYHHRMPLVVPAELHDAWLSPTAEAGQVLLETRQRSDALAFEVYPSDPRGNDARFEGPEAIARVELAAERIEAAPARARRAPADPAPARPRRAPADGAQQRLFEDASRESRRAAKKS